MVLAARLTLFEPRRRIIAFRNTITNITMITTSGHRAAQLADLQEPRLRYQYETSSRLNYGTRCKPSALAHPFLSSDQMPSKCLDLTECGSGGTRFTSVNDFLLERKDTTVHTMSNTIKIYQVSQLPPD